MAGIAGPPDGAEMVESPVKELLKDIVCDPDGVVDTLVKTDGAELLATPVDELFKEDVGNPEAAVEL